MHTSELGKDAKFMPVKYDPQTRGKAIRLVRDHAGDYESEYASITAVSKRLGMAPEMLRKWLSQAEVDAGEKPGGRRCPAVRCGSCGGRWPSWSGRWRS